MQKPSTPELASAAMTNSSLTENPSRSSRMTLCGVLCLLAACGGEPDDAPRYETLAVSAATRSLSPAAPPPPTGGGTTTSTCSGPPLTEAQLERLCNDPEVDEIPRPPDPSGYCNVEVRLVSSTFVTGQGVSDGRGEISFDVTATERGSGGSSTVASDDEQKYNVGQSIGHQMDLGTYRVPLNQRRTVDVCITFTEHDNGGANGQDDVASVCGAVELTCSGHDGNGDGMPDGQVAFKQTLGPASFCGPNVCLGSASAEISVMAADADMDCVPNDEDFTPEICDEYNKGEEGLAVLLYEHFDDNGLTTFFQSVGINTHQVYPHYDYVVYVADNETSNAWNTSGPSYRDADMTYPPTRAGLREAMRHLTAEGYRFDTFVFAHGSKNGPDDADIEVLEGAKITGEWLVDTTDPAESGTERGGIPILVWWSTTCIAKRQIDAWIEIGAKAASGSVDVQFYPNAWGNFFKNWVSGDEYKVAVDDSVTFLVVQAVELYIQNEGRLPPYLCLEDDPLTLLVLNDGPGLVTQLNACAENFFNDDIQPDDAAYNLEEVYDHARSGAENMAIASERTFMGNNRITFGGTGVTWP